MAFFFLHIDNVLCGVGVPVILYFLKKSCRRHFRSFLLSPLILSYSINFVNFHKMVLVCRDLEICSPLFLLRGFGGDSLLRFSPGFLELLLGFFEVLSSFTGSATCFFEMCSDKPFFLENDLLQ